MPEITGKNLAQRVLFCSEIVAHTTPGITCATARPANCHNLAFRLQPA